MKSYLSFALAAALLSSCTYNNDRQPRSSDELARYNDAGQNIAPDTAMYEQPAYEGDTPPTVIHHVYHGPGYYQRNPNQYYTDPYSVYNDPRSTLYHQNYGHDGYARAQAQAARETRTLDWARRPAQPDRYVPAAPAKVYRKVGTIAASKGPAAPSKFATAASRPFTVPKAAAPAPAPRTYAAPKTYSMPVRSTAPRISTPVSHPASTSHTSAPSHH